MDDLRKEHFIKFYKEELKATLSKFTYHFIDQHIIVSELSVRKTNDFIERFIDEWVEKNFKPNIHCK